MKKKIFLLVIAVIVLAFSLVGCTPNVRLSDVYVNHAEIKQFDTAELQGVLPKGFQVAYSFDLNNKKESPFFSTHKWVVVKKDNSNNKLAVYDYASNVFIAGSETLQLYKLVKNEQYIIYTETNSGDVFLRPQDNITPINITKEFEINRFSSIRIPSQNTPYFFYSDNSKYLKLFDKDGYITQIAIEIDNLGYCQNVQIYDNYILQNDDIKTPRYAVFYKIPEERDSLDNPSVPHVLKSYSASNAYASYIGDGRFYVFTQTAEFNDTYDYIYNDNKYVAKAEIFNVETGTVEKEIKDTKYYTSIISNENELMKNDYGDLQLSINDIIKEGYLFADGFNYDEKTRVSTPDQFIMDKNFDVKISLSGKYGKDIKLNKDRLIGISPLMMVFIDGKGFSPETNIGGIRIVNIDGTTAFEKQDGLYQNLFYNNGALVCQKLNDSSSLNRYRFGAFDMNGKEIIDFKYDYMTPFIDGYSLAYNDFINEKDKEGHITETDIRLSDIYVDSEYRYHKPDGTILPEGFRPQGEWIRKEVYRVDKNGNEIIIDDIAFSRTNKLVFKVGAYVCKEEGGYNVKNLKGETLFDSRFEDVFKDVVIDRPNLNEVTICGKRGDQTYIYLLKSSVDAKPISRSIHDVIVPSVVIGSLTLAAIVIIAVIKVKGINKTNVETKANAVAEVKTKEVKKKKK